MPNNGPYEYKANIKENDYAKWDGKKLMSWLLI